MYYKIAKEKVIVGVISSDGFRRYQEKHKRILFADEETGQFVEYREKYYTDDWLRPCPEAVQAELADITRIDEEEFWSLADQLDTGTIVDDGSLEEPVEPPADDGGEEEPEVVGKTAAQVLEERIEAVAKLAGPSESDFVASKNYTKGDVVIIKNELYSVTANIAAGSRIVPYLNAIKTCLSEIWNTKEG